MNLDHQPLALVQGNSHTSTTNASEVKQNAPYPGVAHRGLPIWMDRVSKWYGPVIGLNDWSLRIESGIVALLGPNGAGKSTLMKLLTGQIVPSMGKLRVFGRSVRSPAARRKLGYCSDVDAFYEEMTGRTFVYTMLRLSGYIHKESQRRVAAALDAVGLGSGPEARHADKPLRACSKGNRQRVKMAQALAHEPDLLLLDEPLSGLDPVGRRDFHALFRRLADEGKTLLVSSHDLHDMERLADQVLLVSQGRLLARGTWERVARYLDDQPRQVMVDCDRPRELAALLLELPAVQEVRLEVCSDGAANGLTLVLSTRDPRGLCDRIGQLVRERGFRVLRLVSEEQWAGALFALAEGDRGRA